MLCCWWKRPPLRLSNVVPSENAPLAAVKIMRRAPADKSRRSQSADADSDGASDDGSSNRTGYTRKRRNMTIEQRQEAYNEARTRIFSNEFREGDVDSIGIGPSGTSSQSLSSLAASTSSSTGAGASADRTAGEGSGSHMSRASSSKNGTGRRNGKERWVDAPRAPVTQNAQNEDEYDPEFNRNAYMYSSPPPSSMHPSSYDPQHSHPHPPTMPYDPNMGYPMPSPSNPEGEVGASYPTQHPYVMYPPYGYPPQYPPYPYYFDPRQYPYSPPLPPPPPPAGVDGAMSSHTGPAGSHPPSLPHPYMMYPQPWYPPPMGTMPPPPPPPPTTGSAPPPQSHSQAQGPGSGAAQLSNNPPFQNQNPNQPPTGPSNNPSQSQPQPHPGYFNPVAQPFYPHHYPVGPYPPPPPPPSNIAGPNPNPNVTNGPGSGTGSGSGSGQGQVQSSYPPQGSVSNVLVPNPHPHPAPGALSPQGLVMGPPIYPHQASAPPPTAHSNPHSHSSSGPGVNNPSSVVARFGMAPPNGPGGSSYPRPGNGNGMMVQSPPTSPSASRIRGGSGGGAGIHNVPPSPGSTSASSHLSPGLPPHPWSFASMSSAASSSSSSRRAWSASGGSSSSRAASVISSRSGGGGGSGIMRRDGSTAGSVGGGSGSGAGTPADETRSIAVSGISLRCASWGFFFCCERGELIS